MIYSSFEFFKIFYGGDSELKVTNKAKMLLRCEVKVKQTSEGIEL